MADKSMSKKVKKAWTASKSNLSLKEFARKLVADGETWVENWFLNKKGACKASRKPENVTRANMERSATKAARTKKKS